MSLATDILKRAGVDLAPKSPKQHRADYVELAERLPTRSRNRTPEEIEAARLRQNKRNRRYEMRGRSKNHGVNFWSRDGLWVAKPRINKREVYLGSFVEEDRAGVAVRLYLLWHNRGYENIPTGKKCGYVDYARHGLLG